MTIMRSNRTILLIIAMIFFAAGVWSGCTVGFETEQSGVFPCETDADCLDTYRCNDDNLCEEKVVTPVNAPPCNQEENPQGDIDLDNDGYGTGDNRTNCPESKRAVDCNDDDADVNPGQAELCDSKDNNCDGQGDGGANKVDEFECTGEDVFAECGTPPSHLTGFQYWCIDNTCTLRPANQKQELRCDEMLITCNSSQQAFTYELDGETHTTDDVPQECR